jgi:hypothetical protein
MDVNKPIEVIAIFDEKGTMTPLKFRILGEDGNQVFKVKIKTVDKDKIKIVYRCVTLVNGIQREVELHYMIQEHKWILFNMR